MFIYRAAKDDATVVNTGLVTGLDGGGVWGAGGGHNPQSGGAKGAAAPSS